MLHFRNPHDRQQMNGVRSFTSGPSLSMLGPKRGKIGGKAIPPPPPAVPRASSTVPAPPPLPTSSPSSPSSANKNSYNESDMDDIFEDEGASSSSSSHRAMGNTDDADANIDEGEGAAPSHDKRPTAESPSSSIPTLASQPTPTPPKINKWGASTASFVDGHNNSSGGRGVGGNGSSSSFAVSPSVSPSASDKQWACDICANINYENETQLDAHMQAKHSGLCPQYKSLREVAEGKIRPNWEALLSSSGDRWRTWGEKTFYVASQRDGGREKIKEAHAARAQLEVIVQRWNPDAKVFVFGSSVVMGVWDGMSDIDYMVANVHDMERGAWPPNEKNAVRALTELLKRAGFKYSNLEPVQHARVPIIKHHAAVPLFNSIPKEAEDVVSRTVRWLFTQPLSTQDRIQFEAGLREAVGELTLSPDDDEGEERGSGSGNGGGTCNGGEGGASSSSAALGGGAEENDGGANNKAKVAGGGPSSSSSSSSYTSPILQLWWHSEHISCSATFVTTTHAVKAIVHTPCVPAQLLRRVSPLHDDFQPELYKIDFDLGFRPFGVRNSFLLRNYLNSHPCARPGAVVLKDWSKSSGINNSIGGYYTSYAVNIMWIYYLVQRGVIPYIDPQSIPQSLVGCKDYNPRYVPIFPPEIEVDAAKREAMFRQMGELLVGFFAFYSFEFDWDRTVITLNRSGEPTLKEDLQWNDVAVVQGKKSTRYLQCIEDPYEDNLNLGRHVGDGRRWKVMQELYRGLVSLLKDPFDSSCVFAVTDQSSAAKPTTPAAHPPPQHDDKEDGNTSEPPQAPRPPTTDDMLFLTGLAVKCVEGSAQGHVSEADLKAYITAEPSGRGTAAMEAALSVWRWDQLVRKLGYKQLGGRVYARRVVGAKASKGAISEESFQQQQQGGGSGSASSTSTSSGDLSEKLVRRSASSALDRPANAPPEWVLWTPPSYALPSATSSGPTHAPGNREVMANPLTPTPYPSLHALFGGDAAVVASLSQQRRTFATTHRFYSTENLLRLNSSAALGKNILRRLLRK